MGCMVGKKMNGLILDSGNVFLDFFDGELGVGSDFLGVGQRSGFGSMIPDLAIVLAAEQSTSNE